jgi:hypothetical protein
MSRGSTQGIGMSTGPGPRQHARPGCPSAVGEEVAAAQVGDGRAGARRRSSSARRQPVDLPHARAPSRRRCWIGRRRAGSRAARSRGGAIAPARA